LKKILYFDRIDFRNTFEYIENTFAMKALFYLSLYYSSRNLPIESDGIWICHSRTDSGYKNQAAGPISVILLDLYGSFFSIRPRMYTCIVRGVKDLKPHKNFE